MDKSNKQSWIRSTWYDTIFILLPPFACLLLIYLFPELFKANKEENDWVWFLLIVCVDVGHVYSTIYRTYMDKETIQKNKILFFLSPVLIYLIGVMLYSVNAIYFWRAMTYLAVFHFIRQQYGFLRLYSRQEDKKSFSSKIDTITIYAATIYPLLYWHLQGQQLFNWFVEGDFLFVNRPEAIPAFKFIYFLILSIYFSKEIYLAIKNKAFNIPKNLLMIGTIVSWYMGIIYFKGDLTFTLLNVVSHGIPYYALVWAYGNKQKEKLQSTAKWLSLFFTPRNFALFILFLIVLAYGEELLWDGFVWKEHLTVFPTSKFLPDFSDNKELLSLLLPLLALPQLLHYFIDGFIWKIKKDKYGWTSVLLK
jgi:hypothetical protein